MIGVEAWLGIFWRGHWTYLLKTSKVLIPGSWTDRASSGTPNRGHGKAKDFAQLYILGMRNKPGKLCLNQIPECQAKEFELYRGLEELFAFSKLSLLGYAAAKCSHCLFIWILKNKKWLVKNLWIILSLLEPACLIARSLLVRMEGEGERNGDKTKAHLVASFSDMS